MTPTSLTFALAKAYLEDNVSYLTQAQADFILGCIRSRNVPALASLGDQSRYAYHSIERCRVLRQMAAFFKKNKAFVKKDVNVQNAIQTFFEIEGECGRTNTRINLLSYDDRSVRSYFRKKYNLRGFDPVRAIRDCQSIISDTLGDIGTFAKMFPAFVRVTSGATSTTSRRHSHPQNKMRLRNVSCPVMARPFVESFYNYLGYPAPSFDGTNWNRVVTVPKNWKTDRTIACEPAAALPLQLAFDAYAKRCLTRLGINLSSQSINQDLAYQGSVSDTYATLDLSAASDSLSLNTVEYLLPDEWYKYLAAIRSPIGKIGGGEETPRWNELFVYEKFSSMGNGTTFPLETLIFASICKASGYQSQSPRGKFHVYGDDIIINRDWCPMVIALLDFFGFKVNMEKSFFKGPFRESCGKDYYLGSDVTPVYTRFDNPWKLEMSHLVNSLSRVASPYGNLWKCLADIVSRDNLPLIPYVEDTIRGVWIDPHTAYNLKVVQTRRHVPMVKGYVTCSPQRKYVNSIGLTYWYMQALPEMHDIGQFSENEILCANRGDHIRESCRIGSLAGLPSNKFRRKWFRWIPPSTVTPVHLYLWTDYLTTRLGCKVG